MRLLARRQRAGTLVAAGDALLPLVPGEPVRL
jgi:hypothetical protein